MNLAAFLRWLFPTGKPERTCWVWCPNCRHDLNGDGESFVSDGADGVFYDCVKCGTRSRWDFDVPAPLLLGSNGLPAQKVLFARVLVACLRRPLPGVKTLQFAQ